MGRRVRARSRSARPQVLSSSHPRVLTLSDYRRRTWRNSLYLGVASFVVVFLIGMFATAWQSRFPGFTVPMVQGGVGSTFTCTVEQVTDGDTFRCREENERGGAIRVRLSGVAARESDGSCSPGHPCPSASAEAATAELRRLADGEALTCRPVGETYGRVAAFCRTTQGIDLSCAMVESGTVLKWRRYWGWHICS